MAFASITVTGTYKQADGVTPSVGRVEFRLVNPGANTTNDEIIVPGEIVETLDGTGSFSTTVPTSSAVGGQSWQVVEVVDGYRRLYYVEIPDAGPVDLADLAPIGAADLSATYVLAASLTLEALADTDMTGLADGNTITYDATSETWIAAPPDVADDQTAVDVPFTPAGTLAATDVQAALEELDTEKSATSHDHAGAYSPLVHAHGDLYYTEAEVDSALAGKSDTSHDHSGAYASVVNVTGYGATGDGATDDTAAVQAAIDACSTAGGGTVWFPTGTYIVTGLTLPSHVILRGAGPKGTTLKMKDATNGDVVKTEDFATLTGTDTWLVSAGIPVGFGICDLRIDGNKANQTTAGYGIRIYGKRYTIDNVVIFNTFDDALYSEAGASGGQSEVDDMPEAQIGRLWINTPGGNGVTYRGPHDGVIDKLYVAGATGHGFINEVSATYSGTCDMGMAHIYGCLSDGVQLNTACRVGHLTTESNSERGLYIGSENTVVGLLYAYKNQAQFSGGGASFLDRSVVVAGANAVIGASRIRADYGGCALAVIANDSVIGPVSIEGTSSAGLGIELDASGGTLTGWVGDFSASGGMGVRFCNGANRSFVDANIIVSNCATGIDNVNRINELTMRARVFTNATQVADSLASNFLISDCDVVIVCEGSGTSLTKRHTSQLEQQFDSSTFNLQGAATTGLLLIPDFATGSQTWTANYNSARWFSLDAFQSGAAVDGDYIETTLNLRAGTYKLVMYGRDGNNCGIVQPKLDGSNFGASQDLYAATTARQRYERTGLTVSTSGLHTFRLEVAGKNASSSGYFMVIAAVELIRTA